MTRFLQKVKVRADAEEDARRRHEAAHVATKLQKFLTNNAKVLSNMAQDTARLRKMRLATYQPIKTAQAWTTTGDLIINLEKAINHEGNLHVVFTPIINYHGLTKFTEGTPVILMGSLNAPFGSPIRFLKSYVPFLHEYVHYQDSLRREGGIDKMAGKSPEGYETNIEHVSKDAAHIYLNDPTETNAYYQELLAQLEIGLTHPNHMERLKTWFTLPVGQFIEHFFSELRVDALYSRLTEKNQKRLKKRLAGYYSYMKQKLGDSK